MKSAYLIQTKTTVNILDQFSTLLLGFSNFGFWLHQWSSEWNHQIFRRNFYFQTGANFLVTNWMQMKFHLNIIIKICSYSNYSLAWTLPQKIYKTMKAIEIFIFFLPELNFKNEITMSVNRVCLGLNTELRIFIIL